MKKKLFSIDILHYKGETFVHWWRADDMKGNNCFQRVISVKTHSTYDRLFRTLPANDVRFVHPEIDSLSVSYSLSEVK